MSVAGYRAPAGEATAELREKGSRFLALVAPARDEAAARELLAELGRRHRGASHLCWAWRLGWPPRERAADAGEPHGTAGAPILQVLRGAGLSDVVAAVARWFGGTKLGKGGLARAYGGVARAAVEALAVELRRPVSRLDVVVPFDRLGAVRRLLRPPEVEIVAEAYGESARLSLAVARASEPELRRALAALGLACERPRRRLESGRRIG